VVRRARLLIAALGFLVLGGAAPPQAPSAAPPLDVSVRVDAAKVANRISPRLYGHFLEYMFEGVKFGLHAELLKNRGFEEAPNVIGLPRDWEREPSDRNDDRETSYAWDADVAYAPQQTPWPADASAHALRLQIRARYDGPRGVRQERIPVRAHGAYHVSLWLKTPDYDGAVTVTLAQDREDGRVYAASSVARITPDDTWRQYRFVLTPTEGDSLAKLTILFDGKGKLWLDQVSLMPDDAVYGVRRDVFERVEALKPAFVRWPGGNVAQDCHWQWGMGPRD